MATSAHQLLFGTDAKQALHALVSQHIHKQQKIFVLTDQHTYLHCLPLFGQLLGFDRSHWHTLVVPAGEQQKTIETASRVWKELSDQAAGRDALLINLGGGMVTDLGGFVASCYKRGISTVHIPTSLLGMIDAAIGGKTGLDFGMFKNQIGTYYFPEFVLVFPDFLQTLPPEQFLSGYGEMLKYGLISKPELLGLTKWEDMSGEQLLPFIQGAADIKMEIVTADPLEKNIRKVLNFGHTMGHAFESFSWHTKRLLFHGEAVAAGIIPALWLSVEKCGLNPEVLGEYLDVYRQHFEPFVISQPDFNPLMKLLQQDKKNRGGKFYFVLLAAPAKPLLDVEVDPEEVRASLNWYEKNIR